MLKVEDDGTFSKVFEFFGHPVSSQAREFIEAYVPEQIDWVEVCVIKSLTESEPEYAYFVLGWESDGVERDEKGLYHILRPAAFEATIPFKAVDEFFAPAS